MFICVLVLLALSLSLFFLLCLSASLHITLSLYCSHFSAFLGLIAVESVSADSLECCEEPRNHASVNWISNQECFTPIHTHRRQE